MKSIKGNLTSASGVRDLPPARAKSPALTPWFPAHVKPARVGVYEVTFGIPDDSREYHYWNGRRWWYGAQTPERTVQEFLSAAHHEMRPLPKPWRGLASNPASK